MDGMIVIAGLGAGLLVGLTGVGGGSLMTPMLLLFFGIAPITAVGTDLWFAAITKLVAMRTYHNHDLIDWRVVKRLWWGSIPACVITLLWMRGQAFQSEYVELLKLIITGAVMLTAISMLFQKYLHGIGRKWRITKEREFKAVQGPLTILAGVLLGLLVTLTSVGAGTLGAVMLVYLYPLRLTPPRLIATDIVHAIPLTLLAGLGHLLMGNIDFLLLFNLLLGSIPGILMGSKLSTRLPVALLRGLLAVVLFSVGYKLWSH
jgi:uncharacterized membrane protein YfcA